MQSEKSPSASWLARLLAGSAVVFLSASTFYAVELLAARCEGFNCTYVGVAWIFWLGVFCVPATLLGYLAQRSGAVAARPRSLLRAAWLAHSIFVSGLLVWWLLHET